MELKERIRIALEASAKNLARALDCFEPTIGENPYPERMISYYYIQALAAALEPSNVILELPVTGESGRGKDNHIDALIFNNREVVAAEFKRAWTPTHWEDLARDLVRLKGPVSKEIHRGFFDKRHRRPFVFLGADCWYGEVANAWKSGLPSKGWSASPLFLEAHRDYHCVYSYKSKTCDGFYLTWALLPFNEMAA